MASGRSLELAQLRPRPVLLTEVPTGPFAAAYQQQPATRAQLDAARARVRRADVRHAAAARRAWCR